MSQTTTPERRVLIPLRQRQITQEQLDHLRLALGQLTDHGVSLRNSHVQFTPAGDFLFDDLAIEVGESAAERVRQAIAGVGLSVADPLNKNPPVVKAVHDLVESHLHDPVATPRIAFWFRQHDPLDVHLLEIADEAFDPGAGDLEGIGLQAGSAVPGARSVILYLASPQELHRAIDLNPSHPAVIALRGKDGELLYPFGDWKAIQREFPELWSKHP